MPTNTGSLRDPILDILDDGPILPSGIKKILNDRDLWPTARQFNEVIRSLAKDGHLERLPDGRISRYPVSIPMSEPIQKEVCRILKERGFTGYRTQSGLTAFFSWLKSWSVRGFSRRSTSDKKLK